MTNCHNESEFPVNVIGDKVKWSEVYARLRSVVKRIEEA